MIKKYILGIVVALSIPALVAFAATPTLVVSGQGDNNNVTVTVTGGEPNAPVVLFSSPGGVGTVQTNTIGTTDTSGYWTGTVSSNTLGIGWNTPVYVQVGGYQSQTSSWPQSGTSTGTGSVTFSTMSPNIGLGQNSGNYYISSNSNANGVAASISGNTLTLYGTTSGQANIVVCATGGGCGTITANVGGSGTSSGTGTPMLSQSFINVNQGGQGTLTLSGGATPYTISVPSGSGVSTTLIGNTLYVNGTTAGTSVVQVCSANNGGCTPVTVNVQGTGTATTTTGTGGQLAFTLPITMGQPVQLSLTGGSGSYYLQSPMSSPALASISGNTLMLNGAMTGSGTVTVCSTGGNSCLPISFTVAPALTGTGGGYFYDTDLTVGMSGQDVMELQTRLRDEGYFTVDPTGYFGPLTRSAVMAYQSAMGIPATGYVGPLTRARLNQ
jgi:hypothetical protein